jgi:hypothetical protein
MNYVAVSSCSRDSWAQDLRDSDAISDSRKRPVGESAAAIQYRASIRTRNDICQRPQRRLDLRYGAAVLGDEVRVHAQPSWRQREYLARLLRRLLVH